MLTASGLVLLWVWLGGDGITQDRILQSMGVAIVTAVLLLVWLVAFSGLPGRTRLALALTIVAGATAFASLVRVRGMTGDLVPVLEWRWSRNVLPALDAPPPSTELPPPAPVESSEAPAAVASDVETADASTPPAPATPAPRPPEATASFPQFLGPSRDGLLPGAGLERADWTNQPPQLVWRQPIGEGWSGFAVAGGLAVTQEQRGDRELVVAYDLITGEPRWSHGDLVRFDSVVAGVGPRATPTIDNGRVYAAGATGLLTALDLATGQLVWQADLSSEHAAPDPEWGRAGSPLVTGDLVVINAGGARSRSLVAYNKDSGALVWGGGTARAAYASPTLVRLAGKDQILIFNDGSIAAHDPADGAVLWEQPWPRGQPNVAQPLVLPGDRVVASAGYGAGAKAFAVTRTDAGAFDVTVEWESPRLKSKFANFVFVGGFIYGLDDGVLVCVDAETGERRWKSGRYGHGQMLLAGDRLLIQTEDGRIVLVDPTPEAHREVSSFQALDGKTWNPPAIAGRWLLVRNDREAACYDIGPPAR